MKKNTENKLFLGAGDINIINVVAQKNQILIFNSYLSKFNASIAYDVFENPETSHDLPRIQKISSQNKEKTEGIIFYSLIQFCYGRKIRIDLIEKLIKKNFKIIFFREDLIISNFTDFKRQKKKISLFMDNNLLVINKFRNLN